MTILRPYQAAAVSDLFAWWMKRRNLKDCPIIVQPTGAGKSLVIAEVVNRLFLQWPGQHPRTVVLVPSKELAEQNAEKLVKILPSHIRVGFYSASLNQKKAGADVIVATIGSIYKSAHLLGDIKAVIVDECFTAGTKILTPDGVKNIENILVGDEVINAIGIGQVEAINSKYSNNLIRINFSDGKHIEVTKNHPILTIKGWKQAGLLRYDDEIITDKSMCWLWGKFPQFIGKWKLFKTIQMAGKKLLQPKMRIKKFRTQQIAERSGRENKKRIQKELPTMRECFQHKNQTELSKAKFLQHILLAEILEPNGRHGDKGKVGEHLEANRAQAENYWREREGIDSAAISHIENSKQWMGSGICRSDKNPKGQRLPNLLQARHCKSLFDGWNRIRRELSLRKETLIRREKGCFSKAVRVESIESAKQGRFKLVYNLQVSGHPSYFANGILAHNCHLISPHGAGMYREFFKSLSSHCKFRTCGLTASPFRANGVWLTCGKDPLFNGICHETKIKDLLAEGWLAPLVVPDTIQTRIDTDGMQLVNGDYKTNELDERVSRYIESVADEAIKLASDRKKWIAFTPSIHSAGLLADALNSRAVATKTVFGTTSKDERETAVNAFKSGHLRCLVSVMALATGFNVDDIDCLLWLRPTRSKVLYVQGYGRAMRPAPGKQNALVLDFTDTVERLGELDLVRGRKPLGGTGEKRGAPYIVCPECGNQATPATTEICPECGAAMRGQDEEKPAQASTAPVLSIAAKPRIKEYEVTNTTYRLHKKEGSPDSIRVDYWGGLSVVASEWVCLGHEGYAKARADKWWKMRMEGYGNPPNIVNETTVGMAHDYATRPTHITVNESGKYPAIVSFKYEEETA